MSTFISKIKNAFFDKGKVAKWNVRIPPFTMVVTRGGVVIANNSGTYADLSVYTNREQQEAFAQTGKQLPDGVVVTTNQESPGDNVKYESMDKTFVV